MSNKTDHRRRRGQGAGRGSRLTQACTVAGFVSRRRPLQGASSPNFRSCAIVRTSLIYQTLP